MELFSLVIAEIKFVLGVIQESRGVRFQYIKSQIKVSSQIKAFRLEENKCSVSCALWNDVSCVAVKSEQTNTI